MSYEVLGYIASVVVVISLLMSNIKWLRWLNLLGCTLFVTYGFVISDAPIIIANFAIMMINIYHLSKLHNIKNKR